jgi:hypothetical protein
LQRGSTGMDGESETIRLDGISFSKPFPIDEWNPPKTAALYLVLRKDDGMIIYLGESGNLDDRDFWRGHHKYNCWLRVAGAEKKSRNRIPSNGGFNSGSKKRSRV